MVRIEQVVTKTKCSRLKTQKFLDPDYDQLFMNPQQFSLVRCRISLLLTKFQACTIFR